MRYLNIVLKKGPTTSVGCSPFDYVMMFKILHLIAVVYYQRCLGGPSNKRSAEFHEVPWARFIR
jgi:hypothetical protein